MTATAELHGVPSVADLLARRIQGTFAVDPWGLDVELLALLVAPRRLVAPTEPAVIAAAVLRSTGRPLRVVGIPDVAPVGPLLRRLGGVVDHPAEVGALLRAGHLVLARHPMRVDAPSVRVRTAGWELGRRWRVSFGDG